ncbi:unnamed protein product [Withania somnifera]
MDINHIKLNTSIWEPTMSNMDDHVFRDHQQRHQRPCLSSIPNDHFFHHQQRQFHFEHNPIWPSFPLQNPHHHHLPSSSSQLKQQEEEVRFDHVLNNHVQTLIEDHNDQETEEDEDEEEEEELGAMKEMMFKIAAMQPVDIDPATIRKPKRRNVRISNDPQSVAARLRRERISEKIRILQRLVPGGAKMDTASMLDEAIRYCPNTENWTNIVTPAKALIIGSSSTTTTMANATTFVGNTSSDPTYEVIGN